MESQAPPPAQPGDEAGRSPAGTGMFMPRYSAQRSSYTRRQHRRNQQRAPGEAEAHRPGAAERAAAAAAALPWLGGEAALTVPLLLRSSSGGSLPGGTLSAPLLEAAAQQPRRSSLDSVVPLGTSSTALPDMWLGGEACLPAIFDDLVVMQPDSGAWGLDPALLPAAAASAASVSASVNASNSLRERESYFRDLSLSVGVGLGSSSSAHASSSIGCGEFDMGPTFASWAAAPPPAAPDAAALVPPVLLPAPAHLGAAELPWTPGLSGGTVAALQEQALQERALQERALQERALQEQALQERALQEQALQEQALQERAFQEQVLQEQAAFDLLDAELLHLLELCQLRTQLVAAQRLTTSAASEPAAAVTDGFPAFPRFA